MKLKKILVFFLIVVFWLGSMQGILAAPSFASGSATCRDSGNGYIDVNRPDDSAIPLGQSELFSNPAIEIPASYDSRTVRVGSNSIITPVRNQGQYSTCWAFSVCSAAETSLLKKGLLSKERYLSPLQLSFFFFSYSRQSVEHQFAG